MHPLARDLISGSIGGISTILVMTPLDTARTRLQASLASGTAGQQQQGGATTTGFRTLVRIYREEGARALYKGMAAPVCAQAVYKCVLFGAFGLSSRALERLGGRKPHELPVGFACGAFAGSANAVFVTPVELIRNRLAIQRGFTNLKYSGPIALIQDVVRQEGVVGLFRGLRITLLRDFIGVGFYFATFHHAKYRLKDQVPDALVVPLSGMGAGMAYWTTALPLDAVKTAIQTSNRPMTILDGFRSFANNKRALYFGFVMAICRGIPGSSITFTVQSHVSNLIDSWEASTPGKRIK